MSDLTPEAARTLIAELAGLQGDVLVGANLEVVTYAYRLAARTVHPDVREGRRDLWDQLEKAAVLLGVRK
jgi:uncharacterized protein (DUF697 family)